jgi:hypothetical protein
MNHHTIYIKLFENTYYYGGKFGDLSGARADYQFKITDELLF